MDDWGFRAGGGGGGGVIGICYRSRGGGGDGAGREEIVEVLESCGGEATGEAGPADAGIDSPVITPWKPHGEERWNWGRSLLDFGFVFVV